MPGRRNALYILTSLSLLLGLLTGRAEIFNIAYMIGALLLLSLLWTRLSLHGIAFAPPDAHAPLASRARLPRIFQRAQDRPFA